MILIIFTFLFHFLKSVPLWTINFVVSCILVIQNSWLSAQYTKLFL